MLEDILLLGLNLCCDEEKRLWQGYLNSEDLYFKYQPNIQS